MMFYCETCADKYKYPKDAYTPRSRGPCEICRNTAVCFDVPSWALPMPKKETP